MLAYESALLLWKNRRKRSVRVNRTLYQRIEQYDNEINAVVVRTFDAALAAADHADQALAKGEDWDMHGLPMTIKESYVLADTPATGSIGLRTTYQQLTRSVSSRRRAPTFR